MAATQNPGDPDGADTSLDRLEAALEAIARGLLAKPADESRPHEVLDEVEQRLDAAIDDVKSVLGRTSDQ